MKRKSIGFLSILSLVMFAVGCGGSEEAESESLKVGLIVSSAGANDNGYNEFAVNGLNEAAQRYDIVTKVVDTAADVPGSLAILASSGYDLIFSLEYSFEALIRNDGSGKSIAEQYPDTTFVIFNAFANTDDNGLKIHPNVVEVLFNVNEASFLAGALSVLVNENAETLFGDEYNFTPTDETRAVGFIGGSASSGIKVFGNGFISGVNYIADELGVSYDYYTTYAAGFASGPATAQTISSYYDTGCNVIFAAAGSVAVDLRNEARKSGKLAVDVDADQDAQVPGSILTSVLKNTNVPVLDITGKLVDAAIEMIRGTDVYYSLDSNATGITDLSVIEGYVNSNDEAVNTWAAIKSRITDIENDIASGAVDVVDPQSGEELDWEALSSIVRKN